MNEIAAILLLTITAGSCIPLGGYLASFEHIRARWLEQELRHFLIALGGGILIGAVAVVRSGCQAKRCGKRHSSAVTSAAPTMAGTSIANCSAILWACKPRYKPRQTVIVAG